MRVAWHGVSESKQDGEGFPTEPSLGASEWVHEKGPPGLQSQSPSRVGRAPWHRVASYGAAEPSGPRSI